MADSSRRPRGSESLVLQVARAEQRLMDRRRSVELRAGLLARSLRKRLSSPLMLLVAGGVGLVAGLFSRRRSSASGKSEGSTAARIGLIRSVLRLLAVLRSVAGA